MNTLKMIVDDAAHRIVATHIANYMKRFISNIDKYKHDASGYHNAYVGEKILVKVSPEELDKFAYAIQSNNKLVINGVQLGTLSIYAPYAYPQDFLVLHLEKKYQYQPSVVLQFSKYAGATFTPEKYAALKSKLHIHREIDFTIDTPTPAFNFDAINAYKVGDVVNSIIWFQDRDCKATIKLTKIEKLGNRKTGAIHGEMQGELTPLTGVIWDYKANKFVQRG